MMFVYKNESKWSIPIYNGQTWLNIEMNIDFSAYCQ